MRSPATSASPAPGAGRLSPAARVYVAGVIAISFAGGILVVLGDPSFDRPVMLLLWGLIGVSAQVSALAVPGRRQRLSPSTTVYLAMVLCLHPAEFLIPIWASVIVGGLLLGSRVWYRLLFNAAQLGFAALAAGAVLRVLAPADAFHPGDVTAWLPAVAVAAVTYYTLNVALVVGVVAASTGKSVREAFLGGFGYGWELASTAVLCALAVPTAAGVESGGLWAVVVAAPAMWIFHRLGTAWVRHGAR